MKKYPIIIIPLLPLLFSIPLIFAFYMNKSPIYFAIISTYLPAFLPFFAAGPFLGPDDPPSKSSKISPPPPPATAVLGLDGGALLPTAPGGGGADALIGGNDPGVPGVLGAGVPSLLGGAGVLGVPVRMGWPAGVPGVLALIAGAADIGVEGASEEPEVGGGEVMFNDEVLKDL